LRPTFLPADNQQSHRSWFITHCWESWIPQKLYHETESKLTRDGHPCHSSPEQLFWRKKRLVQGLRFRWSYLTHLLPRWELRISSSNEERLLQRPGHERCNCDVKISKFVGHERHSCGVHLAAITLIWTRAKTFNTFATMRSEPQPPMAANAGYSKTVT